MPYKLTLPTQGTPREIELERAGDIIDILEENAVELTCCRVVMDTGQEVSIAELHELVRLEELRRIACFG